MLKAIKSLFESGMSVRDDDTTELRVSEIQLASAALLIEVSRADYEADSIERAQIMMSLESTFDLDTETLEGLFDLAGQEADEATDLYQFTHLVNRHYGPDEKIALIENLWRVAYADGRLDKFEEHFIRKVAGLIYVPHADFIKAKRTVKDRQESP